LFHEAAAATNSMSAVMDVYNNASGAVPTFEAALASAPPSQLPNVLDGLFEVSSNSRRRRGAFLFTGRLSRRLKSATKKNAAQRNASDHRCAQKFEEMGKRTRFLCAYPSIRSSARIDGPSRFVARTLANEP
jgi:hypothetical protein